MPFDVDLDERDVMEIEVVERGQLDLDLRAFAAGDLWLDGRAAFAPAASGGNEEFGHARSIRQCTFDQLHVVGDHLAEERGEVRDGLDRHDVICLPRQPVRPRPPPCADVDHRAPLGCVTGEVVAEVTQFGVERAVLPREQ